jgi:hypothetical protein
MSSKKISMELYSDIQGIKQYFVDFQDKWYLSEDLSRDLIHELRLTCRYYFRILEIKKINSIIDEALNSYRDQLFMFRRGFIEGICDYLIKELEKII